MEALNLHRRHETDEDRRQARVRLTHVMRERGMSTRAIGDALDVCHATVRKYLAQQVDTGYPPATTPEADHATPTEHEGPTDESADQPERLSPPTAPAKPARVIGRDGRSHPASKPAGKPARTDATEREPEKCGDR